MFTFIFVYQLWHFHSNFINVYSKVSNLQWILVPIMTFVVESKKGTDPGGVLGPKIAGGVPRATENWTQKDRGKNGILGPKRSNFARICTQKIVFVLVDEKKHPKKIVLDPAKVKNSLGYLPIYPPQIATVMKPISFCSMHIPVSHTKSLRESREWNMVFQCNIWYRLKAF